MSWVDECLRDVLSAKKLITYYSDDTVQDVSIGSTQQFIFDGDGKLYQAKIINRGVFMVVSFLVI